MKFFFVVQTFSNAVRVYEKNEISHQNHEAIDGYVDVVANEQQRV